MAPRAAAVAAAAAAGPVGSGVGTRAGYPANVPDGPTTAADAAATVTAVAVAAAAAAASATRHPIPPLTSPPHTPRVAAMWAAALRHVIRDPPHMWTTSPAPIGVGTVRPAVSRRWMDLLEWRETAERVVVAGSFDVVVMRLSLTTWLR